MDYDFDKQKAKEDVNKDGLYPYFEDDFILLKKICGKILKYIAYLIGACIAVIILNSFIRPAGNSTTLVTVLFHKVVDAFSATKPSYSDFFKIQSESIASIEECKDEIFNESLFNKTTKPTFKTWSREVSIIIYSLDSLAECEKYNVNEKTEVALQTWYFYRYEDDIKSIIDISDKNLDINLDMPIDDVCNIVADVVNLLKKDKNYQDIIADANIAKYKIDVCLKKMYPKLNRLNHDTRLLIFGHIYAVLKFTHDFDFDLKECIIELKRRFP